MTRPMVFALGFAIAILMLTAAGLWAWSSHDLLLATPSHQRVLTATYHSTCLDASAGIKPVWECYQLPVANARQQFEIVHASGRRHRVSGFNIDHKNYIRFTPDLPGRWCYHPLAENFDAPESEEPCITIDDQHPDYARGFVAANHQKWIRTADGKAFIPQYLMYDKPDLAAGLDLFITDHGFSGFNIVNLRDFLRNPGYFEAVVLETYRRGGVTHFWIWGDASRKLTPEFYPGNVDELYQAICARLGPLPGWTANYGFDLYEWATEEEILALQESWQSCTSYRHLLGARGYKNTYKSISDQLDFASWEWHRPNLEDYRQHLVHAGDKPAFSEDRFRIRDSVRHANKDYTEPMTLRGLWHALFSGGVANIWGKQDDDGEFSAAYELKTGMRFYRQVVDQYYRMETTPVAFEGLDICLRNSDSILCLLEESNAVSWQPLAAKLKEESSAVADIEAYDIWQCCKPLLFTSTGGDPQLKRSSDWVVIFHLMTTSEEAPVN